MTYVLDCGCRAGLQCPTHEAGAGYVCNHAAELAALRAVEAAARKISADLYRMAAAAHGRASEGDDLRTALDNLDRVRKPADPYSHKTGRMAL